MLPLGYFEGRESERAMAWRAADSLSLRRFLDIAVDETAPDHSTVSRTRHRIDVETHEAVSTWVLQRADGGLLKSGDMAQVVADKGYHSKQTMVALADLGLRSYVPEPDRGGRRWRGQLALRDAVYANRRRIRRPRGRRQLSQRGERLERPHAHLYETGRMRRVHLRGHANIRKRLLVHACGLNLSLLMRRLTGIGTSRPLHGHARALFDALTLVLSRFWRLVSR